MALALLAGCFGDSRPSNSTTSPDKNAAAGPSIAAPDSSEAAFGAGTEEIRTIEHQVRLFPREAALRIRLGELYESAGRFEDAESEFDAAAAIDPNDRAALGGLARLKVAAARRGMGDSRALLLLLDAAESLSVSAGAAPLRLDSGLLEARGDAVIALRGDRDRAERWYAAAGTPSARLKRARLAAKASDPAAAIAHCEFFMTSASEGDAAIRAEALRIIAALNPERAGRWAALRGMPDPPLASNSAGDARRDRDTPGVRAPDTALVAYWRGRASVDSASRPEFARLLARAGRRGEALELQKRLFAEAPEPALADSIFHEMLALGHPDAPDFALRAGVTFPDDAALLRRWSASANPRVREAALAALGDRRSPSEVLTFARMKIASGDTLGARGLLETTLGGRAETGMAAAAGMLFDLVRSDDWAAAYELLPRLSAERRRALSSLDVEAARDEAIRRGEPDRAREWAKRLAGERVSDSAAQLAWWRLARGESEAARAAWALVKNDPELLDDLLARAGSAAAAADLFNAYRGAVDGERLDRAVAVTLAAGRFERAYSLLLSVRDTAAARSSDPGETLSALADSLARIFLAAGPDRLDKVEALDERFTLRDRTRAAASDAMIAADRLDEAIRFGANDPLIRARIALRKGDTGAAVAHLRRCREEGRLDAPFLARLHDLISDTRERFVLALALSTRGEKVRPIRKAALKSPFSRALLEDDPVVLARFYFAWGVPKRTVRLLRDRDATLRSDPAMTVLLVRAALQCGDRKTARAHLATALAKEPGADDFLIEAYSAAKEEGRRGDQIAVLERLRSAAGRKNDLVKELPGLYLAEAMRRGSDRAVALTFLRKARALDPTSAIVLYNIALIHSVANETDSALEAISACLRVSPADRDALLLSASLFKKKGMNAEAAAAYRRAIENGAPVKARHELAVLFLALGDTAGAAVAAGEAYRLAPEDASIARTFGILAAGSERWAEALPALERGVRSFPADGEARRYCALALLENGQAAAARRAIEAHPDASTRLHVAVKADLVLHRPADALAAVRPVRARPGFRTLYVAALADVADQELGKGEVEKAKDLWREWLAFDSRAQVPKALLAATKGASGAAPSSDKPAPRLPAIAAASRDSAVPPRASAVPPRAAASPPPAREATLKAAAEAIRRGKPAEAEAEARRYLAANPQSPTAWNLLAIALNAQGRRQAASEAFASSLRADPNQPEVRSALEELGGGR
jgi:tetratricopeptide (TPR) repeat protein